MPEHFSIDRAKFFLRSASRSQKEGSGGFIPNIEITDTLEGTIGLKVLEYHLMRSQRIIKNIHGFEEMIDRNILNITNEKISELSQHALIYSGLLSAAERRMDNNFLDELHHRATECLNFGLICSTAFRHKTGQRLFLNTAHWNVNGEINNSSYRKSSLYDEGIFISINPEQAAYLLTRLNPPATA